ncbi:MAG TPA: lipopolysaccharide biosynthesis protein [Gammaproteobacteria bacterium]|nr:lipopolysaccharide biosynthesis protein [Gammaproteobacteria bacterium]
MSLYTRGNARRSLFDTVRFRLISQAATASSYIVLVRGIPTEDFGVLSLLYAFIPAIGTVASLGLVDVLRRYQPDYLRAGKTNAAAWLVRTVAYWRLTTNIVVLSVILLSWDYIAPIFHLTSHRLAFAEFAGIILLYFQSTIMQLALSAQMLHRYAIGSTAVFAVVKLVLYSSFSYAGKLSLDTAILTDTMAYGASFLIMRVVYHRVCLTAEAKAPYRPDRQERKRMLRYGLLNNFDEVGVLFMYSTLDNFFLAAFLSTTAVGIYSFYSNLRQMVQNVMPVFYFSNIVQPMLFSVPFADAGRKMPAYFSFLINMGLLLQWPTLVFCFAYHHELVQVVFGGKFIDYSWLLPLIMSFGFLNTFSEPVYLIAQYRERPGIVLLSKVFLFYNVLAMAVLVPKLGVYGAALAAGTAQLLKNLFIWWYVRDTAIWVNARTALATGFPLWGATAGICIGIKALLPGLTILQMIAQMILGGCVIGAALLVHVRTRAVTHADRDLLAALLPARAAPFLRRLGLSPTHA